MKNPFKSKRFQPVEDPDPVPPHLTGMGWSEASNDPGSLPLDPTEAERAARIAGAHALADLAKQDAERQREQMDARLAGVQRGRKYSEGLSR
jgi:hypothetical protein